MSRTVATLVYAKVAGSMARKAVLAYFADRASDDGSGIWTAKQRIADEIECSKQTVITTIRGLIEDGLVEEIGQRKNRNGYTVEYALKLDALKALPDARMDDEGVQIWTGQKVDRSSSLTPRSQTALPKPSLNHLPPSEPIGSDTPTGVDGGDNRVDESKSVRGHRIPAGWTAPPVAELPPKAQELVRQWPAGAYEAEAEAFANFWGAESGVRARKLDWDKTWANRVVSVTAQVLRAEKAGVRHASSLAKPPIERAPLPRVGECETSAKIRRRLAETVGARTYAGWIEPSVVTVANGRVSLTCPSTFMVNWLQQHCEVPVLRACRDVIGERFGGVEWKAAE